MSKSNVSSDCELDCTVSEMSGPCDRIPCRPQLVKRNKVIIENSGNVVDSESVKEGSNDKLTPEGSNSDCVVRDMDVDSMISPIKSPLPSKSDENNVDEELESAIKTLESQGRVGDSLLQQALNNTMQFPVVDHFINDDPKVMASYSSSDEAELSDSQKLVFRNKRKRNGPISEAPFKCVYVYTTNKGGSDKSKKGMKCLKPSWKIYCPPHNYQMEQ